MLRKMILRAKSVLWKARAKVARFAEKEQLGRREVMSVRDVFFMQFDKRELKRYDIIARYLAVEDYFGENGYGFDIYRKMQSARVREDYGHTAQRQFRELLDSYIAGGYDRDSCIVLDKNLKLVDGSHRVALHLYLGIENISVLILPVAQPVDYSIDWFFQKGFTAEEIDLIIEKGREVIEKANTGFSCVIWSPAAGISDSIISDMAYFGRTDRVRRYAFSPAEYRNVVKAIYAADDIEDWKVRAKLEHMRQPSPEIVAVRFYPDCPDFRLKDATGMPLSRLGERVKKDLRIRYEGQVEDYYFDVIMHMADNFDQSSYIFSVLEPGIDMEGILKILSQYSYALAKIDSPYYPPDFPKHIPVGKDADILCLPEELARIAEELERESRKYSDYEVRVLKDVGDVRIRLEKKGCLIYQLDVCCHINGFTDEFIRDAICYRERKKGYMCLSAPYEYLYRMIVFENDPKKTHHLEYLQENRGDYDADLFNKYTVFKEKARHQITRRKLQGKNHRAP